MKLQLLFLTLLCSFSCASQSHCACKVPPNLTRTPNAIFSFENEKKIILCGYQDKTDPSIFSEFELKVCGENEILDFWDATIECRVVMQNNILVITEIMNLPTGLNRSYKLTDWSTERIFFNDGKIVRQYTVNNDIRKYSEIEIEASLLDYENAPLTLNDNLMEIANRLFISSISGSSKATIYLKEFEKKFGLLDGAFAEEYSELLAMFKNWEAK